ncbi:hypothetical protein DL96DRAFT_1672492 [Flagelloscypha sp. PMI_526]|nr:hypothetical protein DL96DRAFT_1672492 [Flagelloscypha sp. PMI_526]
MNKCGRLRILVLGRANAGKTTICERMCGTTDQPIVRSAMGDERGEHNIEDEISYESNPGYVFHDSRGLEAGSSSERQSLRNFIASRAGEGTLRDQLHAIWFCIPVDDGRPFLEAEQEFFAEQKIPVPVIMVFTKCEAQVLRRYKPEKTDSIGEKIQRRRKAQELADEYLNDLASLAQGSPHPPDAIVQIRGTKVYPELNHSHHANHSLAEMHKRDKSGQYCTALLKATGDCLQNDVLKNLLSCVQTSNLNLCIKWAIEDYGHRSAFQ